VDKMKTLITYLLIFMVVALCGCETTFNETQSGALGGSAIGAGLGAIIGNQTGHAGAGTAIGAGAGALAGGLIGEGIRRTKRTPPTTYYQQPATYASAAQVRNVHTKFCSTCGRTYPANGNYCSDDGTELSNLH